MRKLKRLVRYGFLALGAISLVSGLASLFDEFFNSPTYRRKS